MLRSINLKTSARLAANSFGRVGQRAARQLPVLQRLYSSDVFLTSNSANYIDEMYAAWKEDPKSVHISWQSYFNNMETDMPASHAFQAPPTIVPVAPGGAPSFVPGQNIGNDNVVDHLKVQLLVRAYQVRGHQMAKIDPLEISFGCSSKSVPKELTLEHYGFTEKDLDKEITLGTGILPRFGPSGSKKTIREIIEACEKTYCGSFGIEYVHIPDRTKCDWIRERIEIPNPIKYSTDEKRRILDRLIWSTSFESFLSTKFPNDKRFGLEGVESMVPGMKALIDRSVDQGIEDIIIGMPHRGRLNMLSNVVRKPNESIFSEFQGIFAEDEGSGDVKYHLGANYRRPTPSGKKVNLSIVANPSHLEAEDPVVLGQTRAIQAAKDDTIEHTKAMAVLLHGDAAFSAQGVIYETLGFHSLPSYATGGTIHVICNNQIGFTTDPRSSRSTLYPSDLMKSIDAPIFHVNADDTEAVNFIFNLAADYRAEFKSDVLIDIVGYRKHGHNETDQPAFTQPLMYQKIAEKENVLEVYVKQLVEEGSFTKADVEEHKKWVWDTLEDAFKKSKDYEPSHKEWVSSSWDSFKTVKELANEVLPHPPTGVEESILKNIGSVISSTPEDFHIHRNLKRILTNKKKSVDEGKDIDWSTGEALAYGSLLLEGNNVRVSGQDVERGTFSQRHAVLHDQVNEKRYTPLSHVSENQGQFSISNSSLSEYGVMGFEYGYSLTSPKSLVVWEAQFGDFANTAQVIIDQFIAAGESKWGQRSGIVLSLPHGYDGQGPEHSSGRLERYLQMVNEDPRVFPSAEKLERQHQDCNMQIAYPTTPANIFHLLRRQQTRQFRKPLILFFSKSLLRHPLARSSLDEFTGESHFSWIIEDDAHGKTIGTKDETKRVIFCSGQVYAALHKSRAANDLKDTALIRVEQLNPFPYAQVKDVLNSYKNLDDIVWAQEEPFNMGAWSHVQPRFETTLKETEAYGNLGIRYAGRNPSASVASGTKSRHLAEEEALIKQAFNL
ncbi:2-oxoglutarate dehydrogenase E1 component mitochondrial precursor [Nadsonia fulvescens var. elongata DSM 6958]|uniref:2-oxoglutarate dehydrogenase, mitochondrial n=1 Tax=Nadsonia fulvescens var. elongata DSM 6958 TaxID=857566 RepID=A0A1E3PSV3_9ASCO|nr:2-oxoglutarate dehydrogenase E1 component mitochondrial precursor [Nadsonia fulvescens var. elongata DSM 6958]